MKNNHKNLVFINDFHSNLPDGVSAIQKLLKCKNKGSFLIDMGDFSEGNCFYEYSKGSIERYLMRNLFDILVPGNHGFKDIIKINKEKDILNCNIYLDKKPAFKESIVVEINNLKIGLIGVISEDAFLSIPKKERSGFNVKDSLQTVINAVEKLRKKVDFIVLCSHSGLGIDREKFSKVNTLDAILTSHCHSKGNNFDHNGMKIFKADEEGRSLGILEFEKRKILSRIKKIKVYRDRFTIKPFVGLNEKLDEYERIYNEKICDLNPDVNYLISDRKTLLWNLVKDSMKEKGLSFLVNYTLLRNISPGRTLFLKDIHNLVPFNTSFVIIEDDKKKIEKFYKSVPKEILLMSLGNLATKDLQGKFLTTDYLYDNFYSKGSEKLEEEVSVRDVLIKSLLS